MMRLQILLLFVIMAAETIVSSPWTKIKFPVKLLQPDLQAISKYYDKIDRLHAFVHWPDSISFSIRMTKEVPSNDFYLRISGTFQITRMVIMSSSYGGLYYKDGAFYVKEGKTRAPRKILPHTKVTYIQPKKMIKTTRAHLSIKYFSLKELKEAVELFYLNNKNYVDNVLIHHPATFLATVPDTIGHFVEYTFWGVNDPNTLVDGKLRVLIGSGKKGKLILTNDTEAYRLVFDQRHQTFKIPENFDINSKPLESVFGVRMATKGFLAEEHKNAVLMLNDDDLTLGYPITKQHSLFVHDLLQKVKTVEPRYVLSRSGSDSWIGAKPTSSKFQFGAKPTSSKFQFGAKPTSSKFQVHGQVLIKTANFDKNDNIDSYCPFTIEYANKGRQFLFGDSWVDKIYTDDVKLWVEGEGPVPAHKETVSLMY